MHPRITVSSVSTMSWSLAQDLEFYAETGVVAVGIAMRKLAAAGVADGTRQVAAAGLRVGNVLGALQPFHLDEPDTWATTCGALGEAVEVAAALGAPCLLTTTGPAGPLAWEEAADRYVDAVSPVAALARERGVTLALEHTHALRVDVGFVHSLRDAVHLAERAGIGVCLEVNACWAERGLDETIGAAIDRISVVQVSDYAIGTHCTPDRLVPGDGDIPLARILGALLDAGYTGDFDLELVGPRIEREGYRSAVPRAIDAVGELLDGLGA